MMSAQLWKHFIDIGKIYIYVCVCVCVCVIITIELMKILRIIIVNQIMHSNSSIRSLHYFNNNE